jgi:threonine synthase
LFGYRAIIRVAYLTVTESSLHYVSTRGGAGVRDFAGVVLTGLAEDGGLFVPQSWPQLSERDLIELRGHGYGDVAMRVMQPFVGDALDQPTLARLIEEAYATFEHPAVTPLRQIDSETWLLELFHGPTLAFKDCALQLLGRLMSHFLERDKQRLTIIGATSGDTGSAAIEACRDRDGLEIFILHPKGRISDVQRRQMTTVTSGNVHNIAIEGTFDDCQALVKDLFGDAEFRNEAKLGAVNSINWARVLAQAVYYVVAALALGAPARQIAFSVPTGNFGDVYAGYCASRMGLPISQLIVATNNNDILARFFGSGAYQPDRVVATMSPSMDIQIASNFERLLFEMVDRSGEAVTGAMQSLKQSGSFSVDPEHMDRVGQLFSAKRIGEAETLDTIRDVATRAGIVIDPHTAVGIAAGRLTRKSKATPLVCLATAHPAKFPDAIDKALGSPPPSPPKIASLFEREERYDVVANDPAAVKNYVREYL